MQNKIQEKLKSTITNNIKNSDYDVANITSEDKRNIAEEVNIVKEYKVAFDEGLALISSGAAEQAILDAENNW